MPQTPEPLHREVASPRELLGQLEMWGRRIGLGQTRRLLSELRSPQRSYASVLVAGTNGKGSTAAVLSSILRNAGLRVGLYNSPHLEAVEERIRVDGKAISPTELTACLEQVLEASRRTQAGLPTYFESLTLAALCHYQARKVDVAVLEVGLGGRLDATNVVSPRLSIVTSIALDHQEVLGERLEQIAREKAGVARPRCKTFIFSSPNDPARESLVTALQRRGATVINTFRAPERDRGVRGLEPERSVRLSTARDSYELRTTLLGEHQNGNLILAVSAAEDLLHECCTREQRRAAVKAGVASCRWPGRLERIDLGTRWVLLDGAHNLAGCKALLASLLDVREPMHLVFGSLRGKKAADVVAQLAPRFRSVTLTQPPSDRALPVEELATLCRDAAVEEDPAAALEHALKTGESVVVCGSLYLVGELRPQLRERFGQPPPTTEMLVG